jgi:hypothetical protein
MGPSRRVRLIVITVAMLAMGVLVPAAHAQFYGETRRTAGLAPDPLDRSPRLVGMGRLSLVLDDPHHRLDLWEFAGNPAGLLDADSVSALELRPETHSASGVHDFVESGTTQERQNLALRDVGLGFETWRRTSEATAFGLIGDYTAFRHDTPFSADIEQRSEFSLPNVTGIVGGKLAFFAPEHFRYAARVSYAHQSSDEFFRTIVTNGAGEFIDKDGTTVGPPNFFDPDHFSVNANGGGAAIAWVFGPEATLAANYDYVSNEIDGSNVGARYTSEVHEQRPYGLSGVSLVGKLAKQLEYGVDAKSWSSTSESDWVFTISAGAGQRPIDGRGILQSREESGSTVRTRARWLGQAFEIGGEYNLDSRTVDITAPALDDPTSFNYFRNFLYSKPGTDSLVLPDSIVTNKAKHDRWSAGGGVAVHLPFRHSRLGAEYHLRQAKLDQTVSGEGPKPKSWDVHVGYEMPATAVLMVRAGYLYRWSDDDEATEQNEFKAQGITLGLGLLPAGATWNFDAGYVLEWGQADYGNPGTPTANGQQLLTQVRWRF